MMFLLKPTPKFRFPILSQHRIQLNNLEPIYFEKKCNNVKNNVKLGLLNAKNESFLSLLEKGLFGIVIPFGASNLLYHFTKHTSYWVSNFTRK